jgi:hypothetical protein
LTGEFHIRFYAQIIRRLISKARGKNSMRKILVALLVGLLFIGAASAGDVVQKDDKGKPNGGHDKPHDKPHGDKPHYPPAMPCFGEAKSCAVALGHASAYVDKCLVASANDGEIVGEGDDATENTLYVQSWTTTKTVQLDDAKVDPLSVSLSEGTAGAKIDGFINVDDKQWPPHDGMKKGGHHDGNCQDPSEVASVDLYAGSEANAFNAAAGSMKAEGSTFTFNTADVCATAGPQGSLSSDSTAGSFSTGLAIGKPDDALSPADSELPDLYEEIGCFDCEEETPA